MLLNIKKNQLNKRHLKILLISVLVLLFPHLSLSHSEIPLIAVSQIVEHPAIDAIRDGALQTLEEAGLKKEKDFKWVYKNSQGNQSINIQIAQKLVGMKPKVILAISTPSTQAVIANMKSEKVPLVFGAVSDPIGTKVVSSLEKNSGMVTGVSDAPPLATQILLIQTMVPHLKNLGILYNPGEINSVNTLTNLKHHLVGKGINLIEVPVVNSSILMGAAQKLVGQVDALYVPQDNMIISAIETLVRLQDQHKLPIFTSDQGSVQQGALACVGINYFESGKAAGEMILKILNGERAGSIPTHFSGNAEAYINMKALHKLGLKLPKFEKLRVISLG
ncbi:MAG: ABC transporter substrate-binding protein [Holosporales bacterium]|nr:ABC transporter substrate-binding protein [Holosporales bacterium]